MTVVVFRQKCKTCPRTYVPDDLLIGGKCPVCAQKRSWDMDKNFCEKTLPESKRMSDGFGYTCCECGEKHMLDGWTHWDATSQTFLLLCKPCKAIAVNKDSQYHGTQPAWKHALGQ